MLLFISELRSVPLGDRDIKQNWSPFPLSNLVCDLPYIFFYEIAIAKMGNELILAIVIASASGSIDSAM